DLHDFINQPLYTYSSGMVLRLGFSIAVHINFDILLIDEILSVGDISFQEKCIERINSFKEEGKTLIIASQSLELMKTLCHRAVLLENGKILFSGEPEKVIDKYLEVIQEKCMVEKRISQYPVLPRYPEDIERIKSGWGSCLGSGEAKILEVKLKGKNGEEKRVFKNGETLIVDVKYKVEKEINYPHFGVAIFREDYIYCYGPNTDFDKIRIKRLNKGIGSFSIEYKKLILGAGDYRLSVALWDKEEKSPYDYHYAYYKFSIGERRRGPSPLIDIPCFLFFNGAWREKLLCPSFDKNQVRRDNFMEIEKVISKGRWGREKNTFSTNELLRLLLEIKILDRIDSPFVYFLIENENMLIQEACFEIGDYLKPGIIKMFLYYPKVPLLRGKYSLALGISSKKEGKIFQYFPKLINWEFKTAKKDHGIVYLEHRWKLNNP
ncbi:MAG: Wzt carbohydrate-binding domain-containing protein, partial [Candidatus Omnitrophota bacterium]